MSKRGFTVSTEPTTRTYNWTLSEVVAAPGAVSKTMLVINGQSPGPVIEANLGDRIIVNIHNDMSNDTSMHWHGMYMRGMPWMDGTATITQCPIPAGGSMTYNWTVQNTGTTWYHAHRGTQYSDGLYGALILHSPNETAATNKYDDEVTLMLSDLYNTISTALLWRFTAIGTGIDGQPGEEPAPDGGMINGVSQAKCAYLPASNAVRPERRRSLTEGTFYPETNDCGDIATDYFNLTLVANSTYRLRLINSGSLANVIFSIDGHNLTMIEVDGTSIEPVHAQSVELAVAQRASVLVTLDQKPGAYWIRSILGEDQITYHAPQLNTTTLGVLRYAGTTDNLPPDTPAAENMLSTSPLDRYVPADKEDAPDPTTASVVQFNGQYTADNKRYMFFNSSAWTPLPTGNALQLAQESTKSGNGNISALSTGAIGDQLSLVNAQAGVMDLVINNLDDGDHAFHLHGHTFWVMSADRTHFYGDTSSLNKTNPMRRDTLVIQNLGHAVIRFRTDNPGVWAFHCHISWHMAIGLLMTITHLPDQLASMAIPQDISALCAS